MGRQWLHAKRLVAGLKKGRTTSKLTREVSVAAKMGGADPAMNARLFAAVEKAKKESVTKDAIQRAINKGAGIGDEKLVMEHVTYEGRAPHNVPVIVEVYTDNVNRTAPEIRVLFKKGQLGVGGSNKFLFDHVGLVEAHHPDFFWYGIHPVEALFTVMGPDCESVARTTTPDGDIATGVWAGGRIGTFRGLRNSTAASAHAVTVFGSKANVEQKKGADDYAPLVKEIMRFFQTGIAPVSNEETIAIYAFMEAADESKRQGGRPVKIGEVIKRTGGASK